MTTPLNPVLPENWPEVWAARQRMAQLITHTTSLGVPYKRKPYPADETTKCYDCGVQPGQLHVPTCLVERCPVCGGQVGCGHQDIEHEAKP